MCHSVSCGKWNVLFFFFFQTKYFIQTMLLLVSLLTCYVTSTISGQLSVWGRRVKSPTCCVTVQQVVWLGTAATSLAVCGPEPAGGPRAVLCQPDQASGPGELQHAGLRAALDHRGVDRGERCSNVVSRNQNISGWLSLASCVGRVWFRSRTLLFVTLQKLWPWHLKVF